MVTAVESFCEIYVRDLGLNIQWFVTELGFHCERSERDFAELTAGATRLLLNSQAVAEFEPANPIHKIAQNAPRGAGVEIGIYVDDLDQAYAAIVNNDAFEIAGPPKAVPWGGRDFRMVHPDGFYIRIAGV
ncbi:VOC family protein [Streptomyces sp. NPDC059466]|uniref:VOC family protein n=1 Tax=unclassified Streptomyces TaxID=2593676 RepID=UPI0036B34B53